MGDNIRGRVARAGLRAVPAASMLPEVREIVDASGQRWTVYWVACEPTADHPSFNAPQLGLSSRRAPAIRIKPRRRFPQRVPA